MPLRKGVANIGRNIKTELAAGKPRNQAIAIALAMARKGHALGGTITPKAARYLRATHPTGPGSGGGHVGPLTGVTAGRADKLPINVPNGSHVLPADTVSALGQGNSMTGHAVLAQMFPASRPGARAGGDLSHVGGPMFARGGQPSTVPINASDGEFVVSAEDVARVGDGDPQRGHAILDHFIIQVRKQYKDKLAKLPGPVKD